VTTVVNTNNSAIAAQTSLAANQRVTEKTITTLATGSRINSAADDAAGLAISNKMTSQIRSLDMAVRNANNGISMLQTADGATAEMSSMLFRMRELSIQSANDTNNQDGRDALQKEFAGLQAQLTNTIRNTTWNGMKVLDGEPGSGGTVSFHVGASSADTIALPLATLNSSDVSNVLAGSVTVSNQANAQSSVSLIDNALKQIDGERVKWGAMINRLTYSADNAANVSLNTSTSRSHILDTDYAQATAELARSLILNEAGSAMLTQANQRPYYVLALLS
jgi:flagellin